MFCVFIWFFLVSVTLIRITYILTQHTATRVNYLCSMCPLDHLGVQFAAVPPSVIFIVVDVVWVSPRHQDADDLDSVLTSCGAIGLQIHYLWVREFSPGYQDWQLMLLLHCACPVQYEYIAVVLICLSVCYQHVSIFTKRVFGSSIDRAELIKSIIGTSELTKWQTKNWARAAFANFVGCFSSA